MTNPHAMALARQSTNERRPPALNRMLTLATVLMALVAAGCLPEGRRGEGPGPGSGGGSPAATSSRSSASSGPTERPPIVPPTPTPRPTFLVYVVAKGDSLNTIAHRYNTTARSIAFWNRAAYPSLDPESAKYRPDLLKLGWTLFLLPNDTFDEEDLPDASDPSESAAADPAAAAAGADAADAVGADAIDASAVPEGSAIPE